MKFEKNLKTSPKNHDTIIETKNEYYDEGPKVKVKEIVKNPKQSKSLVSSVEKRMSHVANKGRRMSNEVSLSSKNSDNQNNDR